MSTATLSGLAPPPTRGRALTSEAEPRYRTIRGVKLLDCHAPIEKTVLDGGRTQKQKLGVTADDLRTLARNSNRQAASGVPSVLQIGHTSLEDRRESEHPRAVGDAANYRVETHDGEPFLVADLNVLADEYADALTYPRISVERSGWSDPNAHSITAVALLRRKPERDLPSLPYAASKSSGRQLACYSREAAFEPGRRVTPYRDWLRGVGLPDDAAARCSYEKVRAAIESNPDNPMPAIARAEASQKAAYLTFCAARGLRASNPKARERFARAMAEGNA